MPQWLLMSADPCCPLDEIFSVFYFAPLSLFLVIFVFVPGLMATRRPGAGKYYRTLEIEFGKALISV